MWFGKGFNDGEDEPIKEEPEVRLTANYYHQEEDEPKKKINKDDDDFNMSSMWAGD